MLGEVKFVCEGNKAKTSPQLAKLSKVWLSLPIFQNVLSLPEGGLLLGAYSEGGAVFSQPISRECPCTSLLILK